MKKYIVGILICGLYLLCCKKETTITSKDARLSTSVDTLRFDTVFTSTGSVTKSFKIINDNNQKLKLSSVKLMGGNASVFKLNIDGQSTNEAQNIELAAFDSTYVFVQVKINPDAQALPFILEDSVQIQYNGNTKYVQLEAWGQNAIFLRDKIIETNEVWTKEKPRVILGFLYIAENAKLTIQKGCKIYVHPNAIFGVDGTLQINGTANERVYFSGNRLDEPYASFPASWPGILFTDKSKDNEIHFGVFQNAYQALVAQGLSFTAKPKLTLWDCIIYNTYDAGLFGFNTEIKATNLLVSNARRNVFLAGGKYDFNHCTFATYYNQFISDRVPSPVLTINNQLNSGSSLDMVANFTNCLIWGEKGNVITDEVSVNKVGNNPFSISFDHVAWKQKTNPSNATITESFAIENPGFDSISTRLNYYNFRLRATSPAVNKGKPSLLFNDLDDNNRPKGTAPDIGCYESF